jgi:hypothetical protein
MLPSTSTQKNVFLIAHDFRLESRNCEGNNNRRILDKHTCSLQRARCKLTIMILLIIIVAPKIELNLRFVCFKAHHHHHQKTFGSASPYLHPSRDTFHSDKWMRGGDVTYFKCSSLSLSLAPLSYI